LGFSGFADAIYRNVTLAFTAAAATTQIRFADGGLQGLNDESWGIDNVRVEPAVVEDLNLTGQAVGKFTGQPALFQFQASAGDPLVLTRTTPGGGRGEPVNTFDPRLTLMGPTGATITSNDNGAADGRNARIAYTVPAGAGGIYTVRLDGTGSGDFTLA